MLLRFCFYTVLGMMVFLPYAVHAQEEENPYAKATSQQLKEAQSYYDYCSKDEALSKEKDCRCASAAFLDARMALGDNAPKKDIAYKIRYKCFRFLSSAPPKSQQDTDKPDDDYFKDVTDEQLKEAHGVYLTCKDNARMSRYHDCECLAGSFLDLRLQEGPFPKQDHLLFKLKATCKNIVESIGVMYTDCIQDVSNDQYGFERKDYCECYARKWADGYEKLNSDMNLKADIQIRSNSKIYCMDMAGIEAKKRKDAEAAAAQRTPK